MILDLVYLLEGVPGSKLELGYKTYSREKIDENLEDSIAERTAKKKKEIFKQIQNSKPIEGVRELLSELKGCRCLKAVVSGSSKEEIEAILDENIGSNNFDFVISGDDLKEGQGKPDPASFQIALQRMNLLNSEALSPSSQKLGVCWESFCHSTLGPKDL